MKQHIIGAGEGPSYEWSKDHIFVKATPDLCGGRATVVEDTLKPGFHLARHYHKIMSEIFYILAGAVDFVFDDETVTAAPGMTITIPPTVWHEVHSVKGGTLITVFSPGGFERYLAELAALSDEQLADQALMTSLAEKYDTWMR